MLLATTLRGETCLAMQWSTSLATGVDLIDQQHQELIRRINQLLEACTQGKGKEAVGETLNFLEDYVKTHFSAEEKLQRDHHYPEYPAHKQLHDEFIQDVSRLKQEFANEGATLRLVAVINRRVVDWLTQHIMKVDKALAAFVKSRSN